MLRLRRKFEGKEEVRPEFIPSLSVLTVEILWASNCFNGIPDDVEMASVDVC
jgi:hypothetical protein